MVLLNSERYILIYRIFLKAKAIIKAIRLEKILKINNINTNTAFGRVIKFNAPKERVEFSEDDRRFGSLRDLQKVLNSEKTDIYTKNEADRIKGFFKNILGDYNGQNGIIIAKAHGDTVIISGEDAKTVKALEKKYDTAYNSSTSNNRVGRNSCKNKKKEARAEDIKKACIEIASEITKRNENGENCKPETEINLSYKTVKRNGIKRIDTSKFGWFEYSSFYYVGTPKKYDDHKMGRHNVLRSVTYEQDKLEL